MRTKLLVDQCDKCACYEILTFLKWFRHRRGPGRAYAAPCGPTWANLCPYGSSWALIMPAEVPVRSKRVGSMIHGMLSSASKSNVSVPIRPNNEPLFKTAVFGSK